MSHRLSINQTITAPKPALAIDFISDGLRHPASYLSSSPKHPFPRGQQSAPRQPIGRSQADPHLSAGADVGGRSGGNGFRRISKHQEQHHHWV